MWNPRKCRGSLAGMGSGQPLSFRYCQAIGTVLGSDPNTGYYSRRAAEELATVCAEFNWLSEGCTTLVVDQSENRTYWWTFAGVRATTMLAHALRERLGIQGTVDNLTIKLDRPLNQEVFDGAVRANAGRSAGCRYCWRHGQGDQGTQVFHLPTGLTG